MSADTHQDENVQSRSFAKSLERHVKRCNKTSRERTTQSVYSVCIDRPPGLVNYCWPHLPVDSEFCYRLNTEYVFKVQTFVSSSPFAIVQLFSEASELKQLLCFEILISALINVLLKQ